MAKRLQRATNAVALTETKLSEMVHYAMQDAYGPNEQAWAWQCVVEDRLALPFETMIFGAKVAVVAIDVTNDNAVVAVCKRGRERRTIPLADLPLPRPTPEGAEWVTAYKRWLDPLS